MLPIHRCGPYSISPHHNLSLLFIVFVKLSLYFLNISSFFLLYLSPSAVVFGRVLEGMDLVKAIEAKGSQSGKPNAKVVIADSGELPVTETEESASSE
jgi:cyclophilin family peptidyl-prolyl cis-trans isomerase